MRRWHELDDADRGFVVSVLGEWADSLKRTGVGSAEQIEAFEVAMAVLDAVAAKGERLANGEAVSVYGTLAVKARRAGRAEDY